MRTPTLAAAACLLATVAIAPGARAQGAQADVDRATARTLGEDGEKALDAKDYKRAEQDFRRADSLVHAPTLLLGLARALAAQGRLLEAQETYRRIIREGVAPGSPPVFQRAVDAASSEVQTVSPRVGAVTIVVTGAGGEPVNDARVTWDGADINAATLGVKRPADPGPHVIHAVASGYLTAELKVDVPVGGTVDAPLTLQKVAAGPASPASADAAGANSPSPAGGAPPASDQPPSGVGATSPWPWVAFGVGGIGLGVGVVTGVMALGKHSDLSSKCGGGTCGPAQYSDVDSYNTLGMVSTIGFVVAGVGAAAGVTLLILQPKGASVPATGLRIVPTVGPGSLGAIGSF